VSGNYTHRTKKTWADTRSKLEETFRKWGVFDWNVIADPSLKPSQLNNDGWYMNAQQRGVTVRWVTAKEKREMRLFLNEQNRPVDNLRVLWFAIEAMRLNEERGIGRLIQDAYLQLAAPSAVRDPYELMGLRPDCAIEVAEAAYRARAKQLHPDAEHGDVELMKELNAAIERIRSERAEGVPA